MESYSNLNVKPLFATPVGQIDLPHSAEINAGLIRYILDCESQEQGVAPQTQVQKGWQSELGFLKRNTPELTVLNQFFQQAVGNYLTMYGQTHAQTNSAPQQPGQFEFGYEGWAVVLRNGGYQHQHVHTKTQLVGVYCVATPTQTDSAPGGQLSLIDPRSGYLASRSIWESDHQTITPVPGRLTLFPSFLPHRVDEVTSTGTRITINFDVTIWPV